MVRFSYQGLDLRPYTFNKQPMFFDRSCYIWHNPICQNKCIRSLLSSILLILFFIHEFFNSQHFFIFSKKRKHLCHFKINHLCCISHF